MMTWILCSLSCQDVAYGIEDIEEVMDRPGQSLDAVHV